MNAVPVPIEDVDTDELIRLAVEAAFKLREDEPRYLILGSHFVTSHGIHYGEIEAR